MAQAPSREPVHAGSSSRGRTGGDLSSFLTPAGGIGHRGVGVALLILFTTAAHGIGLNTSAGLQVSETWSDNIALAAAGSERQDFVTDISPNVHLNTSGGRLGLNLDASWHGLQYANGTSGNRSDMLLNSTGKLEVIDNWLFVDGVASITQQNGSPFGAQSTSLANINNNRSTVRNYSLAPYVRGMFGPEVSYNLRYQNAQTSSDALASSRSRQYSGGLKWGNPSRLFNFGTDFSSATTTYANQADTSTRSARATAYLNADAHLVFSAFVGRESNNYSLTGQSGIMKGAGAHWAVSERTSLDLAREYHPYGPTAQVSFSHRMPRSALQLSYSRVATTSSLQLLQNVPTLEYNNQLSLCKATAPDPTLCPALVPVVLKLLGQPALTQLPFLSNSINIQRTLQGSLLMTGVRNTVTLTASRSDSRNDSATTVTSDILAANTLILQRSVGLNWAFKVSPISTLTASLSRSRSSSPGQAANDTLLTSTYLLWSTQVTQKLLGSLTWRHVVNSVSSGGGIPYRETAMIATLGYTY